jgi:MFS family permease
MSVGNGLFQAPNNSLIMSNVPRRMLGIAGSVNALVRNLGMIFGTALSVTLLYSRMSLKLGYHVSDYVQNRDDVFVFGMKGGYLAAAAICAVGALLTALRLYGRRKRPSESADME